jgi:hypothetical protein
MMARRVLQARGSADLGLLAADTERQIKKEDRRSTYWNKGTFALAKSVANPHS